MLLDDFGYIRCGASRDPPALLQHWREEADRVSKHLIPGGTDDRLMKKIVMTFEDGVIIRSGLLREQFDFNLTQLAVGAARGGASRRRRVNPFSPLAQLEPIQTRLAVVHHSSP